MTFSSYMKMIFGVFKPIPKSRATDMQELDKNLLLAYCDEPCLHAGLGFTTQAEQDALRKKVFSYKFS
jgi:hypothetical protein